MKVRCPQNLVSGAKQDGTRIGSQLSDCVHLRASLWTRDRPPLEGGPIRTLVTCQKKYAIRLRLQSKSVGVGTNLGRDLLKVLRVQHALAGTDQADPPKGPTEALKQKLAGNRSYARAMTAARPAASRQAYRPRGLFFFCIYICIYSPPDPLWSRYLGHQHEGRLLTRRVV